MRRSGRHYMPAAVGAASTARRAVRWFVGIGDDVLQGTPAWKNRPSHMDVRMWRAAKLLSLCGNPMVISVPTFWATSCRATPRWSERLRWWGLATAVISVTPFVHIRWGVRSGRISDHEVSVRHERFWPYMVEICAVAVSYALMRVLRAPREMVALVVSVAVAMVIITGVTLVWKLSMHVSGTAGAVTVLILLHGVRVWPAALLVPLVGWSRYTLEHHSPAQIVAGAAVGALTPLLIFRRMGLYP